MSHVSARVVTHIFNTLLVLLSTLVQFFYAFGIYTISKKSLVFPVIIVGCLKHKNVSKLMWPQGICSLTQFGVWPLPLNFYRLLIDEQFVALGIAYMQQA
jgi:hypothetical protein